MKLKCKIRDKYLKQILEGKKKVEYRQVESIIFVDDQGKEYEFEVKDVEAPKDIDGIRGSFIHWLKHKYLEVPWDDDLPTIAIRLGRRIK